MRWGPMWDEGTGWDRGSNPGLTTLLCLQANPSLTSLSFPTCKMQGWASELTYCDSLL